MVAWQRPPWIPVGSVAALLSGLLAAQAFPHMDLGVLGWLAPVPLLAVLRRCDPREGALLGLFQGLVFYLILLWWIPEVIAGYGGLGPVLGWSVGLLLMLVLAGFHALFGGVQAWLFRCLGDTALWISPAVWVLLAEYLRIFPLGGFPWGFIGYSQHGAPHILNLAAWLGVSGISFAIMGFAALTVAAMSAGRHRTLIRTVWVAAALGIAAATWLPVSSPEMPSGPGSLAVAAVQGNVPQDEKWQEARRDVILARHLDLTQRAVQGGARLVLWPESSTVEQVAASAELRQQLQRTLAPRGAWLVLGSVFTLPTSGYTNAAFLMDPERGLRERYDKIHLVPFGETVPFKSLLFFIRPLVQAVGDFRAGTRIGVLGHGLDLRRGAAAAAAGEGRDTPFGISICYEVIYAGLVASQVKAGATFLTTITNDAWFGRTAAPAQHFAMAAVRAAETRRWLIRAANTGISGLVAPDGQVVDSSGLFTTALVEGAVQPRRDLTLFVRYPHLVPWACVMILFFAICLALFRNSHARH